MDLRRFTGLGPADGAIRDLLAADLNLPFLFFSSTLFIRTKINFFPPFPVSFALFSPLSAKANMNQPNLTWSFFSTWRKLPRHPPSGIGYYRYFYTGLAFTHRPRATHFDAFVPHRYTDASDVNLICHLIPLLNIQLSLAPFHRWSVLISENLY